MELRFAARWIAVALLALSSASAPPGDELASARDLFKAGKWQEVVDALQQKLRFSVADADTDDLLGQALVKLNRRDEAANHFDRALASMPDDDKRAPGLRKRLTDADPMTPRRDALFRKMSRDLLQCAEDLDKGGNSERALDLLERIRPISSSSDRTKIGALTDRIRSTTEQVDLDKAAGKRPSDGWPEIKVESKRYLYKAHLEPDVAALLGRTMDEIFEYYVKIYFDGNEKGIGDRKPTIIIHASHPEMMKFWDGPKSFIPGGWWSPGEWVVHAYDTRPDAGSLDEMLNTLFHEASHHFMTLACKSGSPPKWFNEGTAAFFEGATAMADGTVLWPDAKERYLQELDTMLKGHATEGTLPTMQGVISATEYPAEDYAWGWGLVYFLQQYEDPNTLEYSYRPLYDAYRDEILQKGGDPLAVFKTVFTGKNSPGKHATVDDFERDWRKWIQETIYPLHFGNDRRALRMAAVDKYLGAAKAAAANKKAKVSEQELLQRALGSLDYVRTKIDKPQAPDPALVLQQADVLEKLGRGGAAAPLLEQLLEMAGDGRWQVDEKRTAEIEQRLLKLDAKNSPLRVARTRAKNLSHAATQLLAEYEASTTPMPLRSYTFASLSASALDDTDELGDSAKRLRTTARDAGLLHGATFKLVGNDGSWRTIFNNAEDAFEHADNRITIEGVRPVGRLCTAVPISGEYEVRAQITRVGEPKIATHHGLIISGTAGGDWMVVSIDHADKVFLKRMNLGAGGGVTDLAPGPPISLKNKLPDDKPIDLVAHVYPEGKVDVTVDGEGPYTFDLPLALPAIGHVGVYVKYGRSVVDNALVELMP